MLKTPVGEGQGGSDPLLLLLLFWSERWDSPNRLQNKSSQESSTHILSTIVVQAEVSPDTIRIHLKHNPKITRNWEEKQLTRR